ncbi:MAG: GspE/PulE family protein [Patescibacteria group bacterium]|nr:GspE/PulE family protein [Patescibacteria group bacterium]
MSNGFGSIDDLLSKQSGQKTNSPVSATAKNVEEKFENKMVDIKKKELEVLAESYAFNIGLPHINLMNFPITQEALKQIPKEIAESLGVVCFFVSQDEFRLGALDPEKAGVKDLLEELSKKRYGNGLLYVISEVSFKKVLKLYDNLPNLKPITKDLDIKVEDLQRVQADVNDFTSVQKLLDSSNTTDMLTIILGAGLKVDASDVHVETEQNRVIVRFRLDGILQDVSELSKDIFQKLISRIKLISALKININNKPQDGRFTIHLPEYDVDVRVSTIPTVFGESVVMRLLVQKQADLTLENLGFSERDLKVLSEEIKRPNGMIITTGPTGSGKTTTLYSILKILNKPGVKIITLEDPVEYRMEGVNQSQIDHSKNYDFATGLRSILRQDPDIVMVGEIRDAETAEISVQAALTGHLMLSTLHTNNAFGAIPRFLSMGTQPFLLAPSLNCVMGQRLVRRLCDSCRLEVSFEYFDEHTQSRLLEQAEKMPEKFRVDVKNTKFYKAVGCKDCNNIGYKGRIGIYEVFVVNKDLEQIILSGQVSEVSVEQMVKAQDMTTMVQDGILKASQGITSIEEIFRVID